ncbi:sugar kinase [candidate division WOR-1 bacterium RIFOXYA2_FULL_36_21]|uniref:Sugar kinase n=1 Tax=candidate division WOR-1 bacterium RIFOXYB2_FULL_36_35 TaxID=1802578 RepID=A0A1F4S3R5_UNCSA|nr:MAG: sugar kinase [candidate division WOR-1 bacterium RIFOXYA2_FULL_36_21]OGC15074.1 MAG: sugar kinase [candidate division WOR-1 bacterium RIFOXYB2_FULL_36_35]OGC16455.1 MAG: sugar kinase [candidate division WOR-1 bacterium RIFOXYA12_FULL_36_13]
MTLLITGTIALDTIETPFGRKEDILGGSSVYAGVSASFFTDVSISGIIGKDFPKDHLDFLKSRNIDLSGLVVDDGETFRWNGFYEYDMNQAHTKDTKLNVLLKFDPKLSDKHKESDFVFLANLDPAIQLKVIDQLKNPRFIAADTMDFWISNKREELYEVIKRVDFLLINEGEIRMFMETPNIPLAAKRLLALGVSGVIVKKGEHGALLFTQSDHFSAPSYPQEVFRDPTGAGDSFAGGFMGYLSRTGDVSLSSIKKAMVIGSTMASFNIEDFSLERMRKLVVREIFDRFSEFRRFSEFEALSFATISED